jgi:hypothetical protein
MGCGRRWGSGRLCHFQYRLHLVGGLALSASQLNGNRDFVLLRLTSRCGMRGRHLLFGVSQNETARIDSPLIRLPLLMASVDRAFVQNKATNTLSFRPYQEYTEAGSFHTGLIGRLSMFESLDEQIKLDEHKSSSNTERMLRWVLGIAIALIVFGGLYWGVHMMQGS